MYKRQVNTKTANQLGEKTPNLTRDLGTPREDLRSCRKAGSEGEEGRGMGVATKAYPRGTREARILNDFFGRTLETKQKGKNGGRGEVEVVRRGR